MIKKERKALKKSVYSYLTGEGIDYKNEVFCNTDKTSRIEAIWDQSEETGLPPEGFLYGAEYRNSDINVALSSNDPNAIVPQIDDTGHGTFISSVAAGTQDSNYTFTGVAPFARIAMVKLKRAKQYLKDYFFIQDDAVAYQENDIMAGAVYLNRLAAELHMPLVICISVGSNSGSHSGVGALSNLLDKIDSQKQRAVVVAGGNEANRRRHFSKSGFVLGEYENVEVNVGDNVKGFVAELWSMAPDLYSIEMISPTGERFPKSAIRWDSSVEYNFVFEDTTVTVDYRVSDILSGAQLIFIRVDSPSKGLWNIRVYGESVIRGMFNIWLPMSNFLTAELFFIRSNPDTTITTPGAAELPITVGAYNSKDNSIYLYSGRGYTTDDIIKPDFVAPGVDVYGAGTNNAFTTMTGTSISAAISAGAVALILEWAVGRGNYTDISSADIRNLIIRGTAKDANRIYPNQEWGDCVNIVLG
ncbi:S8 family peptidase [Lachnospiraceae bacterium ZAX-1]